MKSPFRVRTLRARIALWYGAIITLSLLGYSLTVAISFARHVRSELDRRVHEDIELAARAIVVDASGSPSWPGGFLAKEIEEEEGGGHWVEVWNLTGTRLLTAGTFDPALPDAVRTAGPLRTVVTHAGPVRTMTETVHVGDATFLVRAAVREVGARAQVRSLWTQLAMISAAVLLVSGFGGIAIAHRLLWPLARMADRARRITAQELHERLNVDVTGEELESLRDAFNTTLARLEASFDQLRRFTADASHEIRTPLTALRSVGEVALRSARSADEYREVIGTMLEEVDRLSRLAGELLAIARAEAGEARFVFDAVDLSKLAREVVGQLEVLAEEREQRLVVDAPEPVVARADRLALRQALINLVDNAIKYSPERSQVTVTVRPGAHLAVVEVRDEGAGIPPEHASRIFERFYRIDPSRSHELGGTGLGLSLVKLIAEAHGGRVEVESVVGRGSMFRLSVPAAG
ncbi:MAG TPA: ATP-binding protein [Thermoanaerobaculia bacterium]|nr:ATP-binding protein [Thermoanaerobaculia bacterium]